GRRSPAGGCGPMTLEAVLVVAAALFAVGLYGALSQQVVVMVMMGLELMINGVLLAAAGFWWFLAPDPSGQVLLLVVLAAMTVEMAMGFAVATRRRRRRQTDMRGVAEELSRGPGPRGRCPPWCCSRGAWAPRWPCPAGGNALRHRSRWPPL